MTQSSLPTIRAPIVAILIFEAAALIARAFWEVRLIDGGAPIAFAQDLSYVVVPPILIVLMYPVLKRHGPYLLSLVRRQDLTIRLLFLSILLGVTLRLTFWGGLISLVSFRVLQNADPNAVIGPTLSFGCPEPAVLALSFLVVSFLIPVIEESVNRGLILPSLMHRGKIFAVAVSSVLFAVMHDPQAILVSFIGGLFFALQMINYRTLWATMITHATYSAVAVLDWECISAKLNPVETTPSMVGVGLTATAIFTVGVLLSIFLVTRMGHRDA